MKQNHAEPAGRKPKRSFELLIGLSLTALCLYLALRGIDPREVLDSLARASYSGVPLYLAFLFTYFWLKAIRWRLLLLPLGEFQTSAVASPLMIGFMGNNILPARMGEIIRVFLFSRRFSLPAAAVLSTVVLERLLDTLVVLLFLVIGAVMVGGLPAWIHYSAWVVGTLTLALTALVAALTIASDFLSGMAHRVVVKLPRRLSDWLPSVIQSTAQALRCLRSPRLVAAVVAISVVKWSLMAGMVYVSLRSLSLELPPWAPFLVVGICALGVAIPSAPGFFGVIQIGFWVSLQLFGVSKADAFASSVFYHLGQYIPVTFAGLYYLNRQRISLGDIRRVGAR